MKVIQFTIPVAKNHAVSVEEEVLPHFYKHLHRHNETQITWIIKGTGTLIAGNYMQAFKPGDIYVIGANQPHIFKSDPVYFTKRKKMNVRAITFFFNPSGSFLPVLKLPEMKSVKNFIQRADFGLRLPEPEQCNLITEMMAVKRADNGYRLAAFIKMLQAMADIRGWQTLSTLSAENIISDLEGLRMNDVYQFTMKNFAENITLRQVADIAFMTRQAFCRYFKKHTRKTYINFLNEIRIGEACKILLADRNASMTSIAYEAGFHSAVSFNRVFKKVNGRSPRQYLKEYHQHSH